MLQIRDAVAAANLGLNSYIDTSNAFGGTFVSEFTSYHSAWYAEMHADPNDPAWAIAGGHIHVGGNTPVAAAVAATEITLRTLIGHVDSIVPAPATASLAVPFAVGALLRRRRSAVGQK